MALDSLLASLKSGVAEVTEVQASRNRAFACNPATFERVAEAAGFAAEIQTATHETPSGNSGVTVQSAPTEACTHETPVTPNTINCEVGAGDAPTASRWWLIHYHNRDPVEVACSPEATHAEILERHPEAVAAEPFTPTIRQASAPLTASEETAIRAWLALIEETDPATIAEVISQCRRDADARDYFTRRAAAELPKPDKILDDRRTCEQCANLIARRCQAAKRGEILAGRNYEPIRDLPRRCEGYAPGEADTDPRPGCERWPGLTDTKGTK
jgi:hypothetical protein